MALTKSDSLAGQWEQRPMAWWRHQKDRWLAPLIQRLHQVHITANHISILSGILPFATLLGTLATNTPTYFLAGLIGHVFLDGLDGAMARREKPTPDGFWFDTIADLAGVLCACVYLTTVLPFRPLLPTLLAILYITVIILAVRRNQLGRPYPFLLRPRFPLYAALIIDTFFTTIVTLPMLLLAIAILMYFTITGLRALTDSPTSR